MKKLLFIGIVALMVQSLGAVTLPSSSYSPYTGGGSESSEVVFGSGSMVTGSYVSLGDGGEYGGECTGSQPGIPPSGGTCDGCCTSYYNIETCMGGDYSKYSECAALYESCFDACMAGPSLPLDGGLSILLILSLAGGAVKLLRNRKS